MNVLKGLGTGILSFLLFLSLSIFGIAFLLHSTVLNPDFITSQVDKMDVSALARDIAEEQIGEQLPEELDFLKEAIYDLIDEHEPWVKEQFNYATYATYDFLLGKSDRLEIAISLEALKENLRDSLWETFSQQLPRWLPELVEYDLEPYIDEYLQEFAEQLPPELVGMPEEQLKSYIEQYLYDIAQDITGKGASPEVSGFLEALIKPYFNQYYDEFAEQIPSVLTADESNIPPEVMEQLLLARKYIGYFQTGYYALIAFMVVLAAGIFLINRNVRDTTRALGINLTIYGALEFASTYAFRNYLPISRLPLDMPSSLQTWLNGLYSDLLAPLQMFSLGVLIAGIVLLVVSFVYKPRAVED